MAKGGFNAASVCGKAYEAVRLEERTSHLMGLNANTHHQCPWCGNQATILVDIKTETRPETDAQGNLQYRCTHCHRTFAVDADGQIVHLEEQ